MHDYMKIIINAIKAWTPVKSVNGKTGEIILSPTDIGAQVVGDYALKEDIPSEVFVDTTLTQEGQAADAKVVGDRFAELNSNFVSFSEAQELTNEQKAQARANIDKYTWHTFSDSYGTYTYALFPTQEQYYEIAQTIGNTSGNGSISALEDIVSWLSVVNGTIVPSEQSAEIVSNVIKNYNALKDGGAFTTSLQFNYPRTYDKEMAEAWVAINEANIDNATHSVRVTNASNDFSALFYYNADTDVTITKRNGKRYADTTFSVQNRYADSIAVGDALALKANTSDVIASPTVATVGQTIIVSAVDENGKPTAWETIDPWVLTDESTGAKYKLSVVDGKLTMDTIDTESEA